MGTIIRNFNWADTTLGTLDRWPYMLRASVSNMLNTGLPMLVLWGKDFRVFYNDKVIHSLDTNKHPAIFKPGKEVWIDSWDYINALLQNVINTGEPVTFQDQPIVTHRNGKTEDVYWSFCYSLIPDDEGAPGGVLVTCMETTHAVLARINLAESEARFRMLIEEAPVATCVFVGEDLVMEVINQSMLDIFGKGNDLQGMKLTDAVPELANQPFPDILRNVLRTGETYSAVGAKGELFKEGKWVTYYFDFTYKPLCNAAGEVYAVLDMAVDVTEQQLAHQKVGSLVEARTHELAQANDALHHTNEILKRSNTYLGEFAHAASHDLKEPIRKIQTFASRLNETLGGRMDQRETDLFQRMQAATQRMALLVDDLLTYSEISAAPIQMEEVDLAEKLQVVLTDLEVQIEEKKAVFNIDGLPIVKGYKRQLQQLFQNLVGNALKYSKKDMPPQITIRSEVVQGQNVQERLPMVEADATFHLIEIEDNGIGFEQQYAERIFSMFQRLHGRTEYEGTGIGLSIVRKVVDNHNGFIWAESKPGKGSTFKVLLPME